MEEMTSQLRNRMWDSDAEYHAYTFLKKILNTDSYELFPHVVLRDVFKDLDIAIRDLHVDFLVVTKKGNPVLGIEINGPHHQNNKSFKARDAIKQELFSAHSLPLVFIPIREISDVEDDDLKSEDDSKNEYIQKLETIITDFITPYCYHISIPAYCDKCTQMMDFYYNNKQNFKNNHKSNKFYMCNNCKSDDNPEKPFTKDAMDIKLPFRLNK